MAEQKDGRNLECWHLWATKCHVSPELVIDFSQEEKALKLSGYYLFRYLSHPDTSNFRQIREVFSRDLRGEMAFTKSIVWPSVRSFVCECFCQLKSELVIKNSNHTLVQTSSFTNHTSVQTRSFIQQGNVNFDERKASLKHSEKQGLNRLQGRFGALRVLWEPREKRGHSKRKMQRKARDPGDRFHFQN